MTCRNQSISSSLWQIRPDDKGILIHRCGPTPKGPTLMGERGLGSTQATIRKPWMTSQSDQGDHLLSLSRNTHITEKSQTSVKLKSSHCSKHSSQQPKTTNATSELMLYTLSANSTKTTIQGYRAKSGFYSGQTSRWQSQQI